ncbi:helix-turn-helix domain-containing protein [Pseudomonas sp. CFSAN084952]|nr:helix-turn-helix domain-containing protein [Pseudomonas sp. CFSAN084952]
MHDPGEYSSSDLAKVFSISRSTAYRALARQANGVAGR